MTAAFRRYSPESECAGKRPYSTKFAAKHAAKRSEFVAGRMRPYRCHHCGLFHIGHKPPPRAQRPA